MKPDRVTARIAGALFIAATVASLLSTAFLNPVLNGSDYLAATFAHQDRVIVGAFFLLIAAFASASIAISLYPVLRRHAEGLALGAACFRVMEGVLYLDERHRRLAPGHAESGVRKGRRSDVAVFSDHRDALAGTS